MCMRGGISVNPTRSYSIGVDCLLFPSSSSVPENEGHEYSEDLESDEESDDGDGNDDAEENIVT